MSDVKFTVVGDGDLNSLEGDLARLEKRLENVETRGRRALSATAAGVSAADSLERQRVQQAATDARLWFDRLRTDQPAAAPPTGRHSTLLSNLSAASQASGRSLIQELDSRRGPVALDLALRSPAATVWALDVNERALDLTRRNATALGLGRWHPRAPPMLLPWPQPMALDNHWVLLGEG